jgi:hypothetical protein
MDIQQGDQIRYTYSRSSGSAGYSGATSKTHTEEATVFEVKESRGDLMVMTGPREGIVVSHEGEPVQGCTSFEVIERAERPDQSASGEEASGEEQAGPRFGYASPLSEVDAKPKAGDRFEARRTQLFSDNGTDMLTVVSVEEKHIADGSGHGRGSGTVADAPGDDTRTLYVVTLEDPDGARFEAENWGGNLSWE